MTGVLHFAAAPRGWHEIVAAGLGLDLLLAPRELQFPGHEWKVLRSRLGRGNPATFTLPPNALDRSDERADAEVWHRESTHRLDLAVHAQRHGRPHQQRDSRERTGPATPRRRPLTCGSPANSGGAERDPCRRVDEARRGSCARKSLPWSAEAGGDHASRHTGTGAAMGRGSRMRSPRRPPAVVRLCSRTVAKSCPPRHGLSAIIPTGRGCPE